MKTRIVTTTEEFRGLKEAWNGLLAQSLTNSVYLTWEWLFSWWEIFGDQTRRLYVIVVSDDNDQVVAIAPLIIRKKTTALVLTSNILEFLGTGEDEQDEVCSNYMDVIIKNGFSKMYRVVFEEIIKGFRTGVWTEVILRGVPTYSGLQAIFDASLAGQFIIKISDPAGCAVIDLPGSWEEYMQSLSKGWRDQIKRGRKELAAKGEVQTDTIDDPQAVEKAFEEFTELHQRKWQSQGQAGLFTSPRFAEFHERIIKLFAANRWVAVRRLRCGNKTVAASYKFQYNQTIYFYLPAYDVSFRTKIGLGLIERSYDIEEAIQQGFRSYDFYKAGKGSYKWHLAKSKKEVVDIFIYQKSFQYYVLFALRIIKAILRRMKAVLMGSSKG